MNKAVAIARGFESFGDEDDADALEGEGEDEHGHRGDEHDDEWEGDGDGGVHIEEADGDGGVHIEEDDEVDVGGLWYGATASAGVHNANRSRNGRIGGRRGRRGRRGEEGDGDGDGEGGTQGFRRRLTTFAREEYRRLSYFFNRTSSVISASPRESVGSNGEGDGPHGGDVGGGNGLAGLGVAIESEDDGWTRGRSSTRWLGEGGGERRPLLASPSRNDQDLEDPNRRYRLQPGLVDGTAPGGIQWFFGGLGNLFWSPATPPPGMTKTNGVARKGN
ncbi:hypothetical protein HK102_012154, partial [Quaeritorhiza haematococci]